MYFGLDHCVSTNEVKKKLKLYGREKKYKKFYEFKLNTTFDFIIHAVRLSSKENKLYNLTLKQHDVQLSTVSKQMLNEKMCENQSVYVRCMYECLLILSAHSLRQPTQKR